MNEYYKDKAAHIKTIKMVGGIGGGLALFLAIMILAPWWVVFTIWLSLMLFALYGAIYTSLKK